MSWQEKTSQKLTITTGDGSLFNFAYLNPSFAKEYQTASFEFPNVAGTLVSRRLPKGRKFSIELYLQGDDHLELSEQFQASADDPRPWTLTHPYYGDLTVQPTSLNFDNSGDNLTKITGTLYETLLDEGVKVGISAPDEISARVEVALMESLDGVLDTIQTPSDIATISEANENSFNTMLKEADTDSLSNQIINQFNTANSAISQGIAEPQAALREAQALLLIPSNIIASVETRYDNLKTQVENLIASAVGLGNGAKRMYEGMFTALIGGIAKTVSTPLDDDYPNREAVTEVVEKFSNLHSDVLDVLQGFHSDTYTPYPTTIESLDYIVSLTLSELYNISLQAKQERTLILGADTNPIVLAHRLYGPSEANIDSLINQNQLSIDELLQIPKGKTIVYYV